MRLSLPETFVSQAPFIASILVFGCLVLRAVTHLDLDGSDFLYYHLPFALKMYGKTTYQLFPWRWRFSGPGRISMPTK